MKMIRTALLIGLAAWLLPSPPFDGEREEAAMSMDGTSLALAVMQVVSDASGFCERQPEACRTAGRAWNVFVAKVSYSLGRAFEEWRGNGGDVTRRPEIAGAGGTDEQGLPPTLFRRVPAPAGAKIPDRIPQGPSASLTAPLTTGSIAVALNRDATGNAGEGSENTLEIEDLTVPWNGPKDG